MDSFYGFRCNPHLASGIVKRLSLLQFGQTAAFDVVDWRRPKAAVERRTGRLHRGFGIERTWHGELGPEEPYKVTRSLDVIRWITHPASIQAEHRNTSKHNLSSEQKECFKLANHNIESHFFDQMWATWCLNEKGRYSGIQGDILEDTTEEYTVNHPLGNYSQRTRRHRMNARRLKNLEICNKHLHIFFRVSEDVKGGHHVKPDHHVKSSCEVRSSCKDHHVKPGGHKKPDLLSQSRARRRY